jgi:O-antigen ligase
MLKSPRSHSRSANLPFWSLAAFFIVLWVAGGASRADVAGQVVIRFVAWTLLAIQVALWQFPDWRRVRPIAVLLGAIALVPAIQLIPLPPALWTMFPGRALLQESAMVAGHAQPWRPISVSPGATANALGSLVVPMVVVLLAAQLDVRQQWRMVTLILALVGAGCVLAIAQFSGLLFDNPLINDVPGMVSANFANRNHFALFVAIGCLLAPVWGLRARNGQRWKAVASLAVLPFFILVILATGSRAGILVGVVGTLAGLFIVRRNAVRELRSLPRPIAVGLVAILITGLVLGVGLAVLFDRAVSLSRAVNMEAGNDLRRQALPYVIDALQTYFPIGSGFGTFDAVYRIVEPRAQLSPRYFNHAHNDWIEVILDGGIAGLALMTASLGWWLVKCRQSWLARSDRGIIGRLASVAILLVLLASIVDYPARTPMIMAILGFAITALLDDPEPRRRPR